MASECCKHCEIVESVNKALLHMDFFIKSIDEKLDDNAAKLEKVYQTMYEGNGQPPILVRLAQMEQSVGSNTAVKIETVRGKWALRSAIIMAVLTMVGTFIVALLGYLHK